MSFEKSRFIKTCVEGELGSALILAACSIGPRALSARRKLAIAMCKCEKEWCSQAAVSKIMELVKSGEFNPDTIRKVLKEQEKCSPEKCEL